MERAPGAGLPISMGGLGILATVKLCQHLLGGHQTCHSGGSSGPGTLFLSNIVTQNAIDVGLLVHACNVC